jgi:hypothetical protein
MGGPDPLRRERLLFKKRSVTVLKKAAELAELCGAQVYLLIVHERGNFALNSVEDKNWPPPDSTLVCRFHIIAGPS